MHPFFRHFGSKWSVSRYLPPPRYDRIVEPFAGAAGYACRYGEGKRVDLIDADEQTCAIWDYLLGASQEDVLALPLLNDREDIRTLGLANGALLLLQRWITPQGSRSNWRMPPGVLTLRESHPGSFWGTEVRARVARQLPGIARWRITLGDYSHANTSHAATWQVDPPYQRNRHIVDAYGTASRIDFASLARWVRTLPGDVIVHEGPHADWLPFQPLREAMTGRSSVGARKACQEFCWTQPASLLHDTSAAQMAWGF